MYSGMSACIFYIYSFVKCFCCLTFWYLFLTWAYSSGKVCCQADLIKPKNLLSLFFSSLNKNWFLLEMALIPLNTDVVSLIYFIFYLYCKKFLMLIFYQNINQLKYLILVILINFCLLTELLFDFFSIQNIKEKLKI